MLLIEADGKALLRSCGIATPEGAVVTGAAPALPGPGPWIVKAQVPIGGRGKAGGVVRCATTAEADAALARLFGSQIKGHAVQRCLVEAAVTGADEYYLSLVLDAANYGVRVMLLREGGVDVEQNAAATAAGSRRCAPDRTAIQAAIRELAAHEPSDRSAALIDTGDKLARAFVQHELMLAEINPLFVGPHGCIAGDAKIVIDLNAVHRQPDLLALINGGASIYPEAIRKLDDGFDYVEVDPAGEIGLVTTGAGLSMMLIDEMTARGGKPLNFLDIRTGLLRGDPTRLTKTLGWIAARPSVKVVLVNIFAGITDLAEFADLLCIALERTPQLKVPVVARIVGNRFAEARDLLAARRPDIAVEESLDAALNRVDAILKSPSLSFRGASVRERTRNPDEAIPAALNSGFAPTARPGMTSGNIIGQLSRETPVIVQGATGRAGSVHVRRMKEYGTNIVAGVSARAGTASIEGIPVFPDCHSAVAATGAQVSLAMVPPQGVLAAVQDAIHAGIKLIVTVAEGVPVHDALRVGRMVKAAGALWVGASTPGLAIPGEMKLGFLPDVSLRPGPLAMMSKSGTLSYETGYRLGTVGLGTSIWVGVGGDPVKGVRFPDLLDTFMADERTKGIVLVGEVGGSEEEDFADALARSSTRKPVYALVAGRGAKEGVPMGHAGALMFGNVGTFESKKERLETAGAQVFASIEKLIAACRRDHG